MVAINMKEKEINILGRITSEGKLRLYIAELNAFTQQWKNTRVVATFKVYQPGSSAALRGYYFNCVVPAMKRALWEAGERKTDEQTELWLREMSPIMYQQEADPETGKYTTTLREIVDLDNAELIEHIETIKQLAATDFYTYIEDPSTI